MRGAPACLFYSFRAKIQTGLIVDLLVDSQHHAVVRVALCCAAIGCIAVR